MEAKNILNGLRILIKYESTCDFYAEEGQVFAGSDYLERAVEREDAEELERLGWFIDTNKGGWSRFTHTLSNK